MVEMFVVSIIFFTIVSLVCMLSLCCSFCFLSEQSGTILPGCCFYPLQHHHPGEDKCAESQLVGDLGMRGVIVIVCFCSSLGLLSSFSPLPLYDSDRIEGSFSFVHFQNMYEIFQESGIQDLIQMVKSVCCIKVKNP